MDPVWPSKDPKFKPLWASLCRVQCCKLETTVSLSQPLFHLRHATGLVTGHSKAVDWTQQGCKLLQGRHVKNAIYWNYSAQFALENVASQDNMTPTANGLRTSWPFLVHVYSCPTSCSCYWTLWHWTIPSPAKTRPEQRRQALGHLGTGCWWCPLKVFFDFVLNKWKLGLGPFQNQSKWNKQNVSKQAQIRTWNNSSSARSDGIAVQIASGIGMSSWQLNVCRQGFPDDANEQNKQRTNGRINTKHTQNTLTLKT